MCEFCVKHGDGKKWYLAMENYSQELLHQENRIDYISHFVNTYQAQMPANLDLLEALDHSPFKSLARPFLTRVQKRNHFGQIVPMEDVEQILSQMEGVVRLACVCRQVTTGQKEARYCYALTTDPRLAAEIDDSFNLEVITPAEAIASIRELDKEGLVHSVWTFKTPYIGGLCNCDQDCVAYRVCHARHYFQVMFRGEYVAGIDPDRCNGCRNCMRQCQYGAIRYSATNKKVEIDPRQCYGCGVCRAACHKGAITLHARAEDPVAAGMW
ncbi:MAG TPA: 4Fe-4S binding protein [Anaerolineae bacterium]|nr:4Fe-4S binding protein [Anaerolineae bacterium]